MFSILKGFSLRVRISIVYVVVMGVGGLITSYVGSRLVSSTIFNQAINKVHHDLATAKMVYHQQLSEIKQAVNLSLYEQEIKRPFDDQYDKKLMQHLDKIRQEYGLDFLSLTDESGNVILRTPNNKTIGDNMLWLSPVRAALKGKLVASTEVFPKDALHRENHVLTNQAYIKILPTKKAKPIEKTEETSGMVLIGASPVKFSLKNKNGVLYGGILLNKNYKIVDRVWDLVYRGEQFQEQDVGTVTIFLNDLRISTNVKTIEGLRAVGTRVSEEVNKAVLQRGELWSDRAFVVHDWYISDYHPIHNFDGKIIGILYVGQLEKAYSSVRNEVIFAFFSIATFGFLIIIAISYFVTRSITSPLSEIVRVTKSIALGDLNHEIKVNSKDEIGQLAYSFNKMVASLRKMHLELEEWGNTLEQKVKERTKELAIMQNSLMQSQRLASLGKLAAGIAHEINNPLGGILVLSSLALEDMKNDDPHRDNLKEVIKQTLRCRDIVKGLLQFSRQEKGKAEYIVINYVLVNTLSLIEKQALFHNIEVIKNFQEDIPSILGDDSQMQQVFMNIILNAVQAMKEVGELKIKTYHEPKNDMVIIEISDTGCGIPENLIDRIFDPFFTTKEVGEGTGLGLAIAYGIVTKHHGRMTVISKLNEGTTFTIKIPVVDSSRLI